MAGLGSRKGVGRERRAIESAPSDSRASSQAPSDSRCLSQIILKQPTLWATSSKYIHWCIISTCYISLPWLSLQKRGRGGSFTKSSLFGKKSPKDANSCPSKLMIFGLHEISLFMNCEWSNIISFQFRFIAYWDFQKGGEGKSVGAEQSKNRWTREFLKNTN